jgi:hypothetical protein
VEITIPHRYCGPPESGNGGWVSGTVAAHVPTTALRPAVTVRLASPPPLDRPLSLAADPTPDGLLAFRLLDGTHLVASATASADLVEDVPPPVTPEQAHAAEARYEGLVDHPFPTCFSCGTGRDPEEALCLRPGPLADGTGRYAATWVPREASVPLVWAALDCPGGWSAGIAGRPMVLGTMAARVHGLPTPGEPHVVLAWQRGSEGRKHHSGSALFTAAGDLLARAEATWIAVDPASIRPRESA